MGLDVFLYKATTEQREQGDKLEAQYQEYEASVWEGENYDAIPDADKKEYAADVQAYALKLGLDEYGFKKAEQIKFNSKKYPKHLFEIGYFRSSYNESGINLVLEQSVGSNLYDVFDHTDNEYEFVPDWCNSLDKARQILEEYTNAVKPTKATKENIEWVKQALEIVIETIEYVLAQSNPEHFYLHWSA